MEKINFNTAKILILAVLSTTISQAQTEKKNVLPQIKTNQEDYYIREVIPLPKGEVIEIGSIALMSGDQIAVGTRRGDIWICTGAYETDLTKVTWKKAYNAAHELLGMHYKDGWLYLQDREAYGRIADKDKDGTYETYEMISNEWGMTGDYHEYVFGSTPDKDGNVYTVNCLTGSFHPKAQWRGWSMKIAPDGTTTPFASGVRSPGGIGYNDKGDLFYTDNQGMWNGTSCLKHLKPGSFTGNPAGNIFYKDAPNMGKQPLEPIDKSRIVTEAARIPEYVPPAIQIPHGKVGQSPTAVITDHTAGKFGVFQNQVLIGEQTHSEVQRVYLEEVNGVYQGAVWKMLGGFKCGIVPMRLSNDGTLFVGCTSRGWGSRGGKMFSFERVRATDNIPFEMKTMNATPDGFKISFTKPIDSATAGEITNYQCSAWTYIYQKSYGSPEVDKLTPKVTKALVSKDGMSVTLSLDKLTQGHIHHLDLSKLKSKDSKPLWHPNVYYTLNQIPTKGNLR
jgi:glucose/arabinose dehydrogenase